jgi:hypothetical protein
MSKKQTVLDKATDNLAHAGQELSQQLGIAAMATAAVISMVGHDESKKALVPSQPVFAFADDSNLNADNNPIRREKESNEETGAHFVSYSVAMRTPARSGRH